jgi:hypothetical protein
VLLRVQALSRFSGARQRWRPIGGAGVLTGYSRGTHGCAWFAQPQRTAATSTRTAAAKADQGRGVLRRYSQGTHSRAARRGIECSTAGSPAGRVACVRRGRSRARARAAVQCAARVPGGQVARADADGRGRAGEWHWPRTVGAMARGPHVHMRTHARARTHECTHMHARARTHARATAHTSTHAHATTDRYHIGLSCQQTPLETIVGPPCRSVRWTD